MLAMLIAALAPAGAGEPVTPNASPEARALLRLFEDLSGRYTLIGQHNYPNTRDRNSQFAARYMGEMPAIWSTDMGFAEDGNTDSYLARPDIVEEAKRQHRLGSIITICWHAVPPTADEPVTFRPRPGATPDALASVQGRLLDEQFADVLTPGTPLHQKWEAQVDAVAGFLRELRDAHVPVLWRPYHEMNGDWFWWGGRTGEHSTRALYRQIFERLAKVHQLNNLIWLWSVDRAHQPSMAYTNYYPGNDYLDIVSLDVYGSDFSEAYYNELVSLSQGKPLILGEVGNPPTLEVLESQPLWSGWVVWAGMVRNTTRQQYQTFLDSPRILTLDDPVYWEVTAAYREACGLPSLPAATEGPADFSGLWRFNEEKSKLDDSGGSNTPYKLEVRQDNNRLVLGKSFAVEWGDDRVTEETLSLDGSETRSTFWNAPRVTTANWSPDKTELTLASTTTFTRGGQTSTFSSKEKWSLQKRGTVLSIERNATTFRGEQSAVLIYEKE